MTTHVTLPEVNRERRGHAFYSLALIPPLYATEDTPGRIVYAHYFHGGSDWYVVECDRNDGLAFGWTCLNSDTDNADWGYIHLPELEAVRVNRMWLVERDIHWRPVPVSEAKMQGYRT